MRDVKFGKKYGPVREKRTCEQYIAFFEKIKLNGKCAHARVEVCGEVEPPHNIAAFI